MYHKQANLSAIQTTYSAIQATYSVIQATYSAIQATYSAIQANHFLHLIPVLELSLTVYFPFEIQVSQNS